MRILRNSLSQTSLKSKTNTNLENSVKRLNFKKLRNKYNTMDKDTLFDCISESKESEEEQILCKLNEFGSFSGSDDKTI
jgi:hypothetical protein